MNNNDFVVIIALDFSKAFDTVRHSTLLVKLAQLDLPDEVYNWLVDYFAGHKHLTQYGGATSTMLPINGMTKYRKGPQRTTKDRKGPTKDRKGLQRTHKRPTKDRKGALRAKLQEIGTN